jgi:hypothetical protein
MLQTMEKVDIQIVGNEEKQYLFGYRPASEKSETMPIDKILQRWYDVGKDQDLQKITLDDGVPYQINPKTISEKRKTFTVWRYPFPGDNEDHPADEDCCCGLY